MDTLKRMATDDASRDEQAWHTSERNLEEAQRIAGLGSWEFDLRTGRGMWSENMYRLFGVAHGDPVSISVDEFVQRIVHPDDQPAVLAAHEELLQPGGRFSIEYRAITGKGTERRMQANAVLHRDERGQPQRVTGTVQDITHRFRMEQALRDSEELFKLFMRFLPGLAYIKGPDRRVTYVNERFEEWFGVPLAEWAGKTNDEVWPPEFAEKVRHDDEAVLKEGRSVETLEYLTPPGSEQHTYLTHKFPIVQPGRPTLLGGISIDITEQKRAEQERARLEEQLRESQKLESIGRLAGGVAHDFNNLLTVINGYCDLIIESLNELDPLRQQVMEIRTAGRRAADLTQQLLAFSRRQMVQTSVLNLNAVIRQSEGMLRRIIGEDIVLNTVLEPSLGNVLADAGQVHQVLMNLVVNARDAMPSGGVLTLETQNAEIDAEHAAGHEDLKPGSYVMLAVSDTGVGMDAETRLRAFEPFYTTKEKGRGTGLGLSTVYGIVKQNGGWVWLYSEPQQGTTFRVYLPRVGSEGPQGPVPEKVAEDESRGDETILVVEDQTEVRDLTVAALERCGYRVLAAGSGEGALEVSRSFDGPVHLMVTDVVMPGISGRELARQLREERPEMRVLFTSGYTNNVIASRGVLEEGMEFLPKPFTPLALAARVRQVLNSE